MAFASAAAFAAAGVGAQANAGVVNDIIGGYLGSSTSQKVVLEDISYSIDPSGSGDAANLSIGTPVTAFINISTVGEGSGTLDPANITTGAASTFANFISIEGVLSAQVTGINTDILGNITSIDLGPVGAPLASIYTADNAFADFLGNSDDIASATAKFTNGGSTPAVTFGLDGLDDFYTLEVDSNPASSTFGKIVAFEMTMSVIANNSFVDLGPGSLSDGTIADLYGQGEFQYSLIGEPTVTGNADQFVVGDGKFSVTVVPEPASLALLGLGALAMIRRR
jgi:hypothetical protein